MIYEQIVDEKGFPAQEFLEQCLRNNLTLNQIASQCGRSRATVHRYLVRYELVKPRRYAPQKLAKEILYRMHVVDGLTAVRIAEILGYNHASISRLIKRYGIQANRQLVNYKRVIPITRDELYEMYVVREQSASKIASIYSVGHTTALRWLYDYGIPRRTREQHRGHNPRTSQCASRRLGKDFSETVRLQIFERDNWECLMCGCRDKWLLEAHHIVPVVHGGMPTVQNGATVCHPCHAKIKNRENEYVDFFKKLLLGAQTRCIGGTPAKGNTEATSTTVEGSVTTIRGIER